MKKKAMMIIIVLLSISSIGYGQVNKKFTFGYNNSGDRISRNYVPITQDISLTTGWNIFSANVLPEDVDMLVVMQPIIDTLIKVQDELGNSLEDWGIFGGWTNNIGDILATEGYKINVSANCILKITGDQILLPLNINLPLGWSIISYPRSDEVDAAEVVQPLLTNGTLIKVQDEDGNSYEDWGIFGGWTNNIGNFMPGEGYKVSVNAATQLTISENYAKSAVIAVTSDKPGHFKPAYNGKGVDHMNINIVDIPSRIIEVGDEISAYDDKICVGSVKVTEQQMKDNRIPLIVSSEDENGAKGFSSRNKYKIGLWKKATDTEYSAIFELIKGDDKFEKHESRFVRITGIITDFNEKLAVSETEEQQQNTEEQQPDLSNTEMQANSHTRPGLIEYSEASFRCYPNPLTDDLTIEFFIPADSHVNLSIYSSTGQLIQTIIDGNQESGIKQYVWKRNNQAGQKVPSGIYLCKLKVNNQSFDRKLIVK